MFGGRACGVCAERVENKGKKGREEKGTHVARSELRAIWRERKSTHEATVGLQQASFLERLAIPVIQPNLLILYTNRKRKKKMM